MKRHNSGDERNWVAEYEDLTKGAFIKDHEDTEAEKEFLRRVLGPERYAWLERGAKYGYGTSYDPDEDVEE